MPERPLLLVDVDGVISLFGPPGAALLVRWADGHVTAPAGTSAPG
jgi:hypothetical protein